VSRCNNCGTELREGEGVKAICMKGQTKYVANCEEGDTFCDYTCMQRGCNLCETIHNCDVAYDEGREEDLCGFCKGCQSVEVKA